jgi:hypothetical protein
MHLQPSHPAPENNRSSKQDNQIISKVGFSFLFSKPVRSPPKPAHGFFLLICSFLLELLGVFVLGPIAYFLKEKPIRALFAFFCGLCLIACGFLLSRLGLTLI